MSLILPETLRELHTLPMAEAFKAYRENSGCMSTRAPPRKPE